jgi:adenine-specific DNA-methyltransferase
MIKYNLDLFGNNHLVLDQKFPATRYQGSKYKLTNWIKEKIQYLDFDTVLDGFGGTGSVSFLFKMMGKKVIYNDYLKFNSIIAKALIQNNNTILSDESIKFIVPI